MVSNGQSLRRKTSRIADVMANRFGIAKQSRRAGEPLAMLVATLLSQHTNDRNSHRAYLNLRERYPSWNDVAKAPVREIASVIRVGGIANQKSTRIKGILSTIKQRYGSYSLSSLKKRPTEDAFNDLITLNGVGTKTAACVLVFALGRDVFPVDTHIHRVCGRMGLTTHARSPDDTFEQMKRLVPAGQAYSFHINLIRFGREICRAQVPLCSVCPLFRACRFAQKNRFRKITRSVSGADHNFMLLENV
jgi:endonuclease-3